MLFSTFFLSNRKTFYYKKYFTTQSNYSLCSQSCEQFTIDHTMESVSYGSSKISHLGQIKLLKHFSVGFCLSTFSKKLFFSSHQKIFYRSSC